ncbi:hypothetical protein PEY58_004593 [Salmonella enterica]|nr:hypothetical protein [Salmonella enterica]EKR4024193.1 hypothetical protein [Salmonella enterica]
MDYIKIATKWRNEQLSEMYWITGVVLIWEGRVYGWKDKLRDTRHERPGAVAVDCHGNVFRAEGGNDYDGAAVWVVYSSLKRLRAVLRLSGCIQTPQNPKNASKSLTGVFRGIPDTGINSPLHSPIIS